MRRGHVALLAVAAQLGLAPAAGAAADWSGGPPPVIKRVKKTSPATVGGTAPTAIPAPISLTPLASGSSGLLGGVNWLPAGELTMQQGGAAQAVGPTAGLVGQTSDVGLSLNGAQGDLVWSWRSALRREDDRWDLGAFTLAGFQGDSTQGTLGDDLVVLGELTGGDLPVRGGHLRLAQEGWQGRAFVGGDRPATNNLDNHRRVGGAQVEIPVPGNVLLRSRLVGQQDPDRSRWNGIGTAGGEADVLGAHLEGEVAASLGSEAPDGALRLSWLVPWQGLRLAGRVIHQGADFRTLQAPGASLEGGRQGWDASLEQEVTPAVRLGGAYQDYRTNLVVSAISPQHQARSLGGRLGLGGDAGPGVNLSLSRAESLSTLAGLTSMSELDTLGLDLAGRLPVAERSRLGCQVWRAVSEAEPDRYTINLSGQAERLLGQPLTLQETVSLPAAGDVRWLHTLSGEGVLPGNIVRGKGNVVLEHGVTELLAPGDRLGLNVELEIPLSFADTLAFQGTVEGNLGGDHMAARWSLRYATAFGGAKPGQAAAPVAVKPPLQVVLASVGGVVRLPIGSDPSVLGRLHMLLDQSLSMPLGQDGRYLFEQVPAGTHSVVLDVAALPTTYLLPAASGSLSVSLRKGQHVRDADFTIMRAVSAGGQVLAPGRGGLPFVTVNLRGPVSQQTWTDASGSFVFEGLAAGRYEVALGEPPAESDYTWSTDPQELLLDEATASPPLRFEVAERPDRIRRVVVPVDAGAFEAPAPRRVSLPPEVLQRKDAVLTFTPHPAVPGQPVLIWLHTGPEVKAAGVVVDGGPTLALKARGRGNWSARLPAYVARPGARGQGLLLLDLARSRHLYPFFFQRVPLPARR